MSVEGAGQLLDLARRIAAPGLFCAVSPIAVETPPLLPAEMACVAKAIPRRQHEFAVGRMVLRQALDMAGRGISAAVPIVARADRRPDLPTGIRASLSHSRKYCIAIAACDAALCPGVDIEEIARHRPEGLARTVAPWRQRDPIADAELLAFSAKEALFKSQHPETGAMLDFSQAALSLTPGALRARFGCGRFLSGGWGQAAGHFLVVTWRNLQTTRPEFPPSD